jgi:hypothetical protein
MMLIDWLHEQQYEMTCPPNQHSPAPASFAVLKALSPARAPAGPSVDLLQSANARITTLQRQLAERESQLAALRAQLQEQAEGLSRREVMLGRLGARAGADPEALALAARNEANESMILQLNTTVGV